MGIFENTAFKGGKADKLDKGPTGGAIQLPLSFSKQDNDNGDLKLDFTFGGEEGVLKPSAGTGQPLTISRSGLPASPSTDDLQTKLAGTKKLWDQRGMATVPENSATGGCNWNEADVYGEAGEAGPGSEPTAWSRRRHEGKLGGDALQQDGRALPARQPLGYASITHAALGSAVGVHARSHLAHVQPLRRAEPAEHLDARSSQHGHRSLQLQQRGIQERAKLPWQWGGLDHDQQCAD